MYIIPNSRPYIYMYRYSRQITEYSQLKNCNFIVNLLNNSAKYTLLEKNTALIFIVRSRQKSFLEILYVLSRVPV